MCIGKLSILCLDVGGFLCPWLVDHVNKKCNKSRILLFGARFNNLIVKLSREFET